VEGGSVSKLNLVSYMDETGHSDDPALDYVGMAGFVAPLGSWEVFDAGWKDLMHNAGLREAFHMKDFAHSQGQFREWRENEPLRRALFSSAMKLIVETGATPIGALVSLSGFRSLTQTQQKSFLDPYYLVFQTVTRGAAIEAVFEDDPEEKVAMIYSNHPEYGTDAGRAEQLWHAIKKHYEHGNRMASYKSASPCDVSALQAADIFAYELSHEFENRVKRPAAEMRWGLRQIVGMYRIPSPQILFFDRKELLRRIKESHWPDQTGVQELANNQEQSAQESMMKWLIERGHFRREHFEGFFEAVNAIVGQKPSGSK
jgi:hypothetical protein